MDAASPDPKGIAGQAKPQLQLIPPALNEEVAKALALGAAKYGPWNWREHQVEIMTYLGAMRRHIDKLMEGEEIDPESGAHHLGHVAAGCGIVLDATQARDFDFEPATYMNPKFPLIRKHRRFQRWLASWFCCTSYQVMQWEAWRETNGCVKEACGFEFICQRISVHLDSKWGLYFEHANRGGHAQHYGYPAQHWLLLLALGNRTYGVGLIKGRLEVRLYDAPAVPRVLHGTTEGSTTL